jgi:hypothetical protein
MTLGQLISAAGGLSLIFCLFTRINRTTTGSVAPAQHCIYDGGSTAHTALHGNCLCGAIAAACPAFHTGIPLLNPCTLRTVHTDDSMGTDLDAHTAANTFFLIQIQSYYILQIDHVFHLQAPMQ